MNQLPEICVNALEQHLRPELFKSLCDPTRLSIIAYLATQAEPVTVGTLSELYQIDISGVSRHLKMLKQANVVSSSKQGREVMYTLNSEDLTKTLRDFADAIEECCGD